MPQNNPIGELGHSGLINSDRFDQSQLIQSSIDVNIWYRIQEIPIPLNFTSVLFVLFTHTSDAVGNTRFGIQQEFEPDNFTTPIVDLTLVTVGAIVSPVVMTSGYGPAFDRTIQNGAALGNLTGLGTNVPLNGNSPGNVFEDIPLFLPIRATTLVTGAGGVRPNDVDISLYWNFWR